MKEPELLGELLDVAADRLAAYGYLLTGSQAAGEDLVQDAIVKVLVRRRRLPNVRAAEAYVRAAMRTIHIDGIRRQRRWERAMPELADAERHPDSSSEIAERANTLDALNSLSTQERTAIVLRVYDDLAVAEVADAMGLAVGTVKRYLSTATAKLGTRLAEDEEPRVRVTERGGR